MTEQRAAFPTIITTEVSTGHASSAEHEYSGPDVPRLLLTPVSGDQISPLSPTTSNAGSDNLSVTAYSLSEGSSSPIFRNKSSLALRGNNPEKQDQSLDETTQTDRRRLSDASHLSCKTVPDAEYNPLESSGDHDLEAGHVIMTTNKVTSHRSGWSRLPGVGKLSLQKHSLPVDARSELNEKRPNGIAAKLDPTMEELGVFVDIPPSKLNDLVDPKNIERLTALGGLDGLAMSLRADVANGLDPDDTDDFDRRRKAFGTNRLPLRKSKGLLYLMWLALQDRVLIILSIAAVVSLALGLYQDLGTPPEKIPSPNCAGGFCNAPQVDWVEGVAIIVAILIVVVVGSVNDYQKERQFQKLNAQKEQRFVKCLRSGSERLVDVHEIVVGDILELEPGEIIPVDGVFLSGHNVRCDESSATGESDAIKKATYSDLITATARHTAHTDCFLLSGSKVLEGSGRYLTIGVGARSQYGKIMMSLQQDAEITPLQLKLNRLAELIAKLGAAAGILLFVALMIRFFIELSTVPNRSASEKAQNFIQILIIAVTVIVVAVPEGLPLAVTLALAFATRRMAKINLLVRVLASCETMANATVICTDKTGTLTQNKMTVVAGSVGVHLKFADRLAENTSRTNANDDVVDETSTMPASPISPRRGRKDFSLDINDINRALSAPLRKILNDAIAINSTAFASADDKGIPSFVGSKTETALLQFAKDRSWSDYRSARSSAEILQMFPFSSERKAMGVAVRLPNGSVRLFVKGASEILSRLATKHVYVGNPQSQSFIESETDEDPLAAIPVADFNEETAGNIQRTIIFYANQTLRTIALCYRDFPTWPPPGSLSDSDGQVSYVSLARELTLLAITAIEDPLRPGVTDSVATCLRAGVAVKMCTGDNVLTARSIATQCGIFRPGGLIMEGPVFRKLSDKEMAEVVPRLQVLARSSPTDKELLVGHLKAQGEVVGVTGDGLNDAPALKRANIGFSMGIAGTEVAKEASDIILMDDNFASIVSAIMWGRCVNDGVRKFLQFQISVNIVAVLLTFISAVASSDEQSVLTAVQLLWVNLIMDTFAALALATDPASMELLKRKPDRKMAPLISPDMWKMIIGQSLYQLVVTLVLHFAGRSILNFDDTTDQYLRSQQDSELSTLVFNAFVWCQIFNQLNARVLDRRLNVLSGFWRNYYFMTIFCIMAGGQALIIEIGGDAFSVTRIGGRDWGISIVIGLLSLPIGVFIRLLPTEPVERYMIKCRVYPDPNTLPIASSEAEDDHWNEAITRVTDNLAVFNKIKGGRARSSSIVRRSRFSASLDEHHIRPSSLMAMVPTLVATSLGAGWKPDRGGSLSDPASMDPSRSSTALWLQGVSIHPDTDRHDPLVQKYGSSLLAHSRNSSTASSYDHSRNVSTSSKAPSSPVLDEIVLEDSDMHKLSVKPQGLAPPAEIRSRR